MSGTCREVFPGVWDWSVDPFRGQGRVGDTLEGPRLVEGPSQGSEMGGEDLRNIRDGKGDPPEGLGWVEGPSLKFGSGPRIVPKARNGSGGPSRRSRTGQGTFQEVWNRSGGPLEGQKPSWRSGTGWGMLPEVRDGSWDI